MRRQCPVRLTLGAGQVRLRSGTASGGNPTWLEQPRTLRNLYPLGLAEARHRADQLRTDGMPGFRGELELLALHLEKDGINVTITNAAPGQDQR